jgi:hypothetical protein
VAAKRTRTNAAATLRASCSEIETLEIASVQRNSARGYEMLWRASSAKHNSCPLCRFGVDSVTGI